MGEEINHSGDEWSSRTRTLIGDDVLSRLANARVCVVGVGGVGGYAAEMLARSGVGHLTLIDADTVAASNINRQLIALQSTVGQPKTDLFARRFRDINPAVSIDARQEFITPEAIGRLLDEGYDYVVDAIDTVAPKVALIAECMRRSVPVVSSMGAGGRTDASKVEITDLWQTSEDGLARAVRQRLKKMGLRRPLKVAASREAPHRHALIALHEQNKRSSFGTLATIPALFGIHLASYVINKIISSDKIVSHNIVSDNIVSDNIVSERIISSE
ncbi:MAG: tRNA threonylcarbamoyladenosine dehydratase, partial [Muribaculaceae bacterium]|nr:tRNA threonylcarbamoyladenosine dehydratase [Muribaculaceae bacterium]